MIILFTTSAGFFIPMPSSGWAGFIFKGILFLIDLLLIAMLVLSPRPFHAGEKGKKEKKPSIDDTLASQELKETQWEGFGNAFKTISNEYCSIIRRTFSASCASFYLRGKQGQLQIHSADGADLLIEAGEMDGSLVESVFMQKIPRLTGTLPSGTFLPGMPDVEIQSFLGVPLHWGKQSIGVLALGSESENDFSEEDRGLLVSFADLLTQIMASYHRGLVVETDHEIIKTRLDLDLALKSIGEEDEAFRCFVDEIKKLFPFDRFTVCLSDGKEGWIRFVHGQMDQQKPGMRFSLDEGLVGWVLKRKAPLLIQDIQKGDYLRPRYLRDETTGHGLHSFLCVPLGSESHFKGCLSLESANPNQYNDKIKGVLQSLADQLENALDRMATGRSNRVKPSNYSAASQFEIES